MSNNVWQRAGLPCMVVALVLIGSPDYPALDRALAAAFAPVGLVRAPATQAVRLQAPLPAGATVEPSRGSRGVILPLYVSFAALQALDVHSTLRALTRDGAREANRLMAGVVRSPVAFLALKAAGGAGIIYLTERVWKRNRTGAIVLMAAFNSLYAAVVANNYRVADP